MLKLSSSVYQAANCVALCTVALIVLALDVASCLDVCADLVCVLCVSVFSTYTDVLLSKH